MTAASPHLATAVAWWFCPRGVRERHAVLEFPRTFGINSTVTVLCGQSFMAPLPTSNDRAPKTRAITERCDTCSAELEPLGLRESVWDS